MKSIQELRESQHTLVPAATQLSSSMEELTLSPAELEVEVQKIRDELQECALYSGVGVFYDRFGVWENTVNKSSVAEYKNISIDILTQECHQTLFTTIPQSIASPKQPTAVESSHSPPFIIAVFVSREIQSVNNVDDIICPFLPRSAPHLQHIPKLFFITAVGDPDATPPHFPDGTTMLLIM